MCLHLVHIPNPIVVIEVPYKDKRAYPIPCHSVLSRLALHLTSITYYHHNPPPFSAQPTQS